MTPRIQSLVSTLQSATSTTYQPLAPFLYPFLQGQQRCASILSSLSDVKSSYNKKIRRGRGPASGKGKTAGRGTKGQKAHGKVPFGFNGGQTKDEVVAGKRGWTNIFAINLAPVNLDRIQAWIDKGRLDPTKPITLRELSKSRCIHQAKDGVKLLAKGKEELRSKINIVVSRASAEAIKSIEETGGSVVTRFYSPFAIKKILGGQMDPLHSLQSRLHLDPTFASEAQTEYDYRLPDPVGRKDVEYYRDSANRGYLSYTVEEGQNPSLFFKAPGPWRRSLRLGADTALQQERAGDADGKPIEQSGAIATKLQRAAAKTEEKMW